MGTQQTTFAINSGATCAQYSGAGGLKGLKLSSKQAARITSPTTGTIIALDPDIPPNRQRVGYLFLEALSGFSSPSSFCIFLHFACVPLRNGWTEFLCFMARRSHPRRINNAGHELELTRWPPSGSYRQSATEAG